MPGAWQALGSSGLWVRGQCVPTPSPASRPWLTPLHPHSQKSEKNPSGHWAPRPCSLSSCLALSHPSVCDQCLLGDQFFLPYCFQKPESGAVQHQGDGGPLGFAEKPSASSSGSWPLLKYNRDLATVAEGLRDSGCCCCCQGHEGQRVTPHPRSQLKMRVWGTARCDQESHRSRGNGYSGREESGT